MVLIGIDPRDITAGKEIRHGGILAERTNSRWARRILQELETRGLTQAGETRHMSKAA